MGCGAQEEGSPSEDNGNNAEGSANNADDNGDNNGDNNNADDGPNNAPNNSDNNNVEGSANNADNNSDNDDGGVDPSQIPPTDGALEGWLERKEYMGWPAESGAHGSTGPHFGAVRTWVNDALLASLESGNEVHPVGAASIKELYGNDGQEALGHSVMVKVVEGPGGDTWFWQETYQGRTYASSVGAGICTGCHGDGVDFFLSPFPLQ
jgi:hypothetical protein